MAISLSNKIPKEVTNTTVNYDLTIGAVNEQTSKAEHDRTITIDLNTITFEGEFDSVDNTIFIPTDSTVLYQLEVGDEVTVAGTDSSGATLQASTLVASIDENTETFIIDKAPTGIGSGTVTLESDPASKSVNVYKLEERFTSNSGILNVELYATKYDLPSPSATKVANLKINMEKLLELQGVTKVNDETITL